MSDQEPNIYTLDAAYKPFPSFEEWQSRTTVDPSRWDRYNLEINHPQKPRQEVLDRALEIAKRAAAIDTGAIEGLYEVDRGFTYTVAFEASAWESALAQKGENVKPLFEAQLHAYDYVLDLATKAEPISEAAIRILHEEVCRAQATYRVTTAAGPQEQVLPKGQYKLHPNHVRTRSGTNHSYAPVDVTPEEMARLVKEFRGEAFLKAHPILQASYAHYGLVVIHPFADGNGRVARALASVFTYRAISMPIIILSDQKEQYLVALENADNGNYQSFVDFMLVRALDTIQLVNQSVKAALLPSVTKIVEDFQKLYITKGGYTQDEVDSSGKQLFKLIGEEFSKRVKEIASSKISGSVSWSSQGYNSQLSTHRVPLSGSEVLTISFFSHAPAGARTNRLYGILVPKDAGVEDDIIIKTLPDSDIFTARIDEVRPTISGTLDIRIKMFVEHQLGIMLSSLKNLAEQEASRNRK